MPVSQKSYVLGADLGGTNLRLALADQCGHILQRWSASTVGVSNPHEIIRLIRTGADHLLEQGNIPSNQLTAVAVGAPGVTNASAGIVIATSYLLGWCNVPLRALLEAEFNIPAAIDNDVNAGALGEAWQGAAEGTHSFVFLAIGTGIGAGIILNGKLLQGSTWIAGEVGYMLVPGVSEHPVTESEPGALEALAGGEGIRAQWQALWSPGATALPQDLKATQILDQAEAGDPLATSILNRTARALAYAIYNISLILNCPLIVLGGRIGMHPALCAAVREILSERGNRAVPMLAPSTLGEDAQLIGAIRLALDTASAK